MKRLAVGAMFAVGFGTIAALTWASAEPPCDMRFVFAAEVGPFMALLDRGRRGGDVRRGSPSTGVQGTPHVGGVRTGECGAP